MARTDLITIPSIEDLTRRTFISGALASALLIACGDDDEGEPTAQMTRTYVDSKGRSIEIPMRAQRVAVIDPNFVTTSLVDLGLIPIGATTASVNPGGGFAPTLGEEARSITSIGATGQADIEKLAALQPDLILYSPAYQEISFETLSAIAPTIEVDAGPLLADRVNYFADILGREQEARQVLERWKTMITDLSSRLGLQDKEVAAPLIYTAAPTFLVFGPQSFAGDVLSQLGLSLKPDMVDGKPLDDLVANLSLEQIGPLLQADTLVVMRYFNAEGADANFDAVTQSPVWRSLPAVRRGRVATLNVQEMLGAYGVRGVELAVESLGEQFASFS